MLHKLLCIAKYLFIVFLIINSLACYPQKYDAELINVNTFIEASENKLIQTNNYEIRINNRNGDKYAEISIPYSKLNKVSDLEASITDNSDKVVRKLKKDDIIEKSGLSDISFYTDTYVKEFKLRHNTYPYTLRYSFRYEVSQFLHIAYWYPVIDTEIPTLNASLKLSTPSGYKVYYRSGLTDGCKIDSVSGRVFYSWNASYLKTVSPELFAPPVNKYIPFVEVVPEKFIYEQPGTNKSWETYGDWNLSLLSGLDDLPFSEKARIEALVRNIDDDKEKVRILFHYLQDATRYINVSIKTGGLKPYPASYVAANKYGDCKALSNYFKSCLALVNIKACYTTISASEEIDTIDAGFPSQQFNHVILFIPLKQDTLWIDCTSDLAFGYLGTFTQNRQALVLDDNTSKLITTPLLSVDDVAETCHITAELKTDGTVKAEFNNRYKGDKYELLFYVSSGLSETERSQYLGKRIISPGFQMDSYAINKPGRDVPEIELKYSATSEQQVKIYGKELLVKIIPLELPIPEDPKKRKLPVQINYPVNRTDSIQYKFPVNHQVSALPENKNIISKYGIYRTDYRFDNNSVKVFRYLIINSGTIPLSEYPEYYSFIKSIIDSETISYITLIKN
jgi:transglutaminase-like putative cysteine protease